MAIFLLYNLVNSLNASYEMLSEYYTEAYYSLFKSFFFNNNNIDIICIIIKQIYTMNYIYNFSHFLCIKCIALYQTKWSQLILTKKRRGGKQKSDTFMQTMSSKPNNKHWILHLCLYISDIMFALKEHHMSPVQLGNIQLSSHPFGHTPLKLLQTAPSLHFPHSLSQYSPWKPCSQSLKTCVNIINWDVRFFMIV